jgi:hypothetical protein
VASDSYWRFKHPTIGDAYAEILVRSPELLGIYIHGSAVERLVEQVTCGDVGIEKAVVIPKSLFSLMLLRLQEFSGSKSHKSAWLSAWEAKRALQSFLARRCSKEFLALYLAQNPGLLDDVSEPGLFLYAVPEVRVAERLHEFSLLPEDNRRKFVETVTEYAIRGEDGDALSDERIRRLFTDAEFDDLLRRARTELLPRLDDVRQEWQSNHRPGDAPDEHMQQLLDFFETLKKRFADDAQAKKNIEREIRYAHDWIVENTHDEPERKPRKLGKVAAPEKALRQSSRSIFDDVDADDGELEIPVAL